MRTTKVQNLEVKRSVTSGQIVAHKNMQVFFTWKLENKVFKHLFYEWTTAKFTRIWRLLGMTALSNLAAVSDAAFHSVPRKGYQSKLLVVLSMLYPEIAMMS